VPAGAEGTRRCASPRGFQLCYSLTGECLIEQVEFRGYRNLWLAIEGGSATPAEIEADRISCEAGLGGSTPEDEMAIFPDFLKKIRKRMAPYGVKLPLFDHPRLGKV